jgi:AraC-like DNA-binding protein
VHEGADVEVIRWESATGWSEMVHRRPDQRLSPLVDRLCGYRERSQAPLARCEAATSRIPVIVSFGDSIDILDLPDGEGAGRFGSFVAGLHPGHTTTQYLGGQFGLQLDLTPLGAYRIFGVPGAALSSRVVPLGDVTLELGASLPDRLACLPTWSQRFALVEDVLGSLAERGPDPDPVVAWMWRQLHASGGQVRIADLVAETGWSHRYVAARFREQVGVAPKVVASVMRFERAAQAVAGGEASLADVAARYGYSDQSHLTREFVRLSGSTPGQLAR